MASKINENAEFLAGGFQVIEQLCFFAFGEIIDGFDFNYQFVINEKISDISFFQVGIFVEKGNFFL